MTAVRIEIIVLEVEHFTSPTANFTTKGADFAAWFAQHDYVPAVVFPVDRMPPPPLTAKSVLTEIPRWGSRSVVKDVLWVRRDSLYRPRVEAWADAQLSVDTQLSARPKCATAHPAATSRTNLATALALLSRWRRGSSPL
jgi:hypothetical protein